MSEPISEERHREIQELLGVYALDAVDHETAAMIEEHLEGCVKCSIEVAQHHEVAGLLANSGGTSPSTLWDGIASQLDGSVPPSWERLGARLEFSDDRSNRLVGPVAGGAGEEPTPTSAAVVSITAGRRSRWTTRLAVAAAAAAVVVAVVLGVQDSHLHHQESAVGSLSAAEQSVLASPSTKKIELTASARSAPAPTGSVTVVLSSSGTGFVEGRGLSPLPADKTYQLWGVVGGQTISLGLLGHDPNVVAFSVAGDESVNAFAITAEHAGGVVQSSNAPVVSGEVTA